MSIERSGASAAPASPTASTAKPQTGAGDASGEGAAPSFMALLATSMEPIGNAPPTAAVPTDDPAADATPSPQALPEASALLLQSLSWAGTASGTDAAVLAAAVAPQAGVLAQAAPGEPPLPAMAASGGLANFAHKLPAAYPAPDGLAGLLEPQAGTLPALRSGRAAAARAADTNQGLQEAGSLLSAKGMALRASDFRLAADAAAADWRGALEAQIGGTAALGLSLSEGGALIRQAANSRNPERQAPGSLNVLAGSGAASSWVGTAPTGASTAGLASYSLEAGIAAPATSVAEKVHYWVSRGVQNAELQLDAFGGGSVAVSISVLGNEAQVEFRSDQPETRKMLQDAMPHLKDMLKGEGLLLSGGFVGTSAQQEPGAQEQRNRPQGTRVSVVSVEAPLPGMASLSSRAPGRTVDVFV